MNETTGVHISPRGEQFQVAGQAGPVELMSAPEIPAEARAELLVIKAGTLFLCARPDGDVRPRAASGEGFYADDTRHLSELRISFGEAAAVLLSHSVETGHRAVVNATNPTIVDSHGVTIPQETINLRRTLAIADRLYCSVALRNFHSHEVSVPLKLSLGADFADVFEIRGVQRRPARGRAMVPKVDGARATFGYEGQDGLFRETLVEVDVEPKLSEAAGECALMHFEVPLRPGEERSITIVVTPSSGGRHAPPRSVGQASADLDADLDAWAESCTRIATDNLLFQTLLGASLRDLHALLTPATGGRLPAAGIPWYVAPFGRDSLLTAYECLMVNPGVARETLAVLAALQATADEPWRDAEPGKILHELRAGELARAGLVPHTPYYGSVDSTPLFVMLAAAYYRWTADLETLAALRPALDAALEWIDRYGDHDGDGFVEYERRSPAGLVNQGWKDSHDSIVNADGSLAEGPLALVEVQGYVYLAKLRIADVYDALGEPDRARALVAEAGALRAAFNEAYWMPDEGTFALALDGRKRRVGSVASNAGHCLYCGIVDADRAESVCERLMAPDMFCGWGIRTLSADSPAFNPMSYHNGSVWPHDNAIIAAGLKRYGAADAAVRIATALFDVGARARDFRLAELYCGFDRWDSPEIVHYPVACLPQAWAAAAPFMLLQALLGVSAFAPARRLEVIEPHMPDWLGRAELHGLQVADARVSLAFSHADGITGFSLLEQQGDLAVTMAPAPRSGEG